jgi:outer membrane protein assembly factor BamB
MRIPLRLTTCRLALLAGSVFVGLMAATPVPIAAADKAAAEVKVDPLDWPHWRGPEANGISREKNLPAKWTPDGENVIWKNEEIATRSTPIIMRGKLYTLARNFPDSTKEGEKVVCVDAATGKKIWENAWQVFLTDVPAERVAWSSVVGDPTTGNVYALGVCGIFVCLDGETGKTLWMHSMSEEYGMIHTYGGRTNVPIIFEDQVIISCVMTGWGDYAVPAHRFVGFDKKTGQPRWISSTRLRPPDTTYSTPMRAVFNGQVAFVFGSSDGSVHAIQPRTGKLLWKYDASLRGISTSPLVVGHDVYCGHAEENVSDPTIMGAMFKLDGTGSGDLTGTKKVLWDSRRKLVGRAQPLLIDDRLYCIEDGSLMFVLDPKTGEEIGKQKLGTIMMGSPVFGDGKIYAGERSNFYIMEPSAKGVKVLQRLRFNPELEDISGSVSISHGRVYIPTSKAMYCIGLKDAKVEADPLPPARNEAEVTDTKPAQIQLSPIESLLRPGDKVQFEVSLFNVAGQFLKKSPGKFTLTGAGKISDSGQYEAPKDAGHSFAIITAEAEGLKIEHDGQPMFGAPPSAPAAPAAGATKASTEKKPASGPPPAPPEGRRLAARVRIVPPLPWSFDITDKRVPPTWIGASYRHQVREVEGNPMLVKITTIPLGTRSQCWMGHWDLHDYTIQADMRGSLKNDKMPDMGLVNQRYTLDVMGSKKQIEIRSWTAQYTKRFAKTIPFDYQPDQWYTLKFASESRGGSVTLRGKVWPRGQKEPANWTIEATDDTGNLTGSPGMFGNASDAEILIDNVSVFANK